MSSRGPSCPAVPDLPSRSPDASSGELPADSGELYTPLLLGMLMPDWARVPGPPTDLLLLVLADAPDAPAAPYAWYLIPPVDVLLTPAPLALEVLEGRSEPEYALVRPFAAGLAVGLLCLAPIRTSSSLSVWKELLLTPRSVTAL